MKINELIKSFHVYTTNEEKTILDKLKTPVLLSSLSEHDQFIIEQLVKKSLVVKIGTSNPTVVSNNV